jgi:ABC-type sugar transport system ATPase subunit
LRADSVGNILISVSKQLDAAADSSGRILVLKKGRTKLEILKQDAEEGGFIDIVEN